MFGVAKRLASVGVLGINRRNLGYTLRYNPRRLYPLVDDKLLTKERAQAAGLAVPALYHKVEIERQIKSLPEKLLRYPRFVIKPAQGSGGDGIVVISGRSRDGYRKTSGVVMSQADLQHHVSNILSGLYSLGGQSDKALIEYMVQSDPVFDHISYLGVPDIRIITLFGVPVMAMVRLPTRESDGKANLHQGAIGAGIDLATGRTLTAVRRNDIVTEHPDTGQSVVNVDIPNWHSILTIAASCYDITGLGFQGVDIVLDRELGPLILEINARPGLNIQIANRCGLLHRLEKVEANRHQLLDLDRRVAFARQHFMAVST